jgi:hypothetical protein
MEYGQRVHVQMEFDGHVGGRTCDGASIQVRKADGSGFLWVPAEYVEALFGVAAVPLKIATLQDDRHG